MARLEWTSLALWFNKSGFFDAEEKQKSMQWLITTLMRSGKYLKRGDPKKPPRRICFRHLSSEAVGRAMIKMSHFREEQFWMEKEQCELFWQMWGSWGSSKWEKGVSSYQSVWLECLWVIWLLSTSFWREKSTFEIISCFAEIIWPYSSFLLINYRAPWATLCFTNCKATT